MAINRSTLHDRLENSPHVFDDVVYAVAERQGSVSWRIYATNPAGQHLFLDFEPTKAAAGATAARFRRWLREYNERVY